jgi:hypothetical protein
MTRNLQGCAHNNVLGSCGNLRGRLVECRCEELDRLKNPLYRMVYEDNVVTQVMKIIAQQKGHFSVNLVFFACGGLLGEEIVIFKLLHKIRETKRSGVIHISLVDISFNENIQATKKLYPLKCGQTIPFEICLGYRGDLQQLLQEVSLCLPSGVTLEGAVYGSPSHYLFNISQNPSLKHDLLIGEDIGNTLGDVAQLQQASRTQIPAIILIKTQADQHAKAQPQLCNLDGHTIKCIKLN